jgi:hypothetical protein
MKTIQTVLSVLFPVKLPRMHHVTVRSFGTSSFDIDAEKDMLQAWSMIGRAKPKQYRDAIDRFNKGGN